MFEFVWYLLSILINSNNTDNSKQESEYYEHLQLTDNESNNCLNPKLKSLNIPNYLQGENEDSIDLQTKSLIYIFNRFKISYLKPFLKLKTDVSDSGIGSSINMNEIDIENDISDIDSDDDDDDDNNIKLYYDFDYFDSNIKKNNSVNLKSKILMNEKLDKIYNIESFKKKLLSDPYRILIDYNKNKFRSLLILNDYPSNLLNLNNNLINNDKNNIKLPSFNSPNFQFNVLKSDDSIEKYIEIIVFKSNIYCEHKINNKIKIQILQKIINKQKKFIKSNRPFNKDERANIIKLYVQKLSFYIQVQRIFKATLKSKERNLKQKWMKDNTIQSYKNLKSERSKSRLLLLPEIDSTNSPTKDNHISITNNNNLGHESDCQYYSDAAESQASSSTSSTNFSKHFSTEEKALCFEESKIAVRLRIERERSFLMF